MSREMLPWVLLTTTLVLFAGSKSIDRRKPRRRLGSISFLSDDRAAECDADLFARRSFRKCLSLNVASFDKTQRILREARLNLVLGSIWIDHKRPLPNWFDHLAH